MKFNITFFLLTLTFAAQAQHEIDEQVWKPFIKAFNTRDTPAFMAVHSKDLARIPRDGKAITTFAQYQKQNEDGNKRAAADTRMTIELRFIERVASETQAYDVGIYKTTVTTGKGASQSHYGKFFVVLRKEDNRWKILVDSDSSEGGTISEKDFINAKPMN
jgi:uncharacterized protein (TIGR02246 family)